MLNRLEFIKRRLKGHRVYYSSFNPKAEYLHDIEDAGEDMQWLIYEVERLQRELDGGGKRDKSGGPS
jgi:hypothetical protein